MFYLYINVAMEKRCENFKVTEFPYEINKQCLDTKLGPGWPIIKAVIKRLSVKTDPDIVIDNTD